MAKPGFSIAAVAAVAVLAGCSAGPEARAPDIAARGAPSVQVMSKGVTIAGPRGFCVDPGATRETADGAFVLLGSCAVISGNPGDAKPKWPAMLTASVTPATAPLDDTALDRMAGFFASAEGRAALARAEGTTEAEVLDLARDDAMVLVHARDGAHAGDIAGDYWRAVFEAGGQLVTITVSGFRATPIAAKDGARLARAFADAIRRANGRGPSAGEPAGGAAAKGGLASLFNRLL